MEFTQFIDLASERLGGRTLLANDEFFAPKENLLKPGKPVFIEDKFTSRGKWMDGWETRRRRSPGHDWVIVKLGARGVIRGLVVDTSFFTGNYPEYCMVEACDPPGAPSGRSLSKDKTPWVQILSKSHLKGGAQNLFAVSDERPWSCLRLNIYPDGGVARLRVHGEVAPDAKSLARSRRPVDLAAALNGGRVVAQSDMFFGSAGNMLLPGPARNMGDGWETKRRRGPGHDWAVVKLGLPGTISAVEVDTSHFKGNAPASCRLEGCFLSGDEAENPAASYVSWEEILPQTALKPHSRRLFRKEIKARRSVNFARLSIYPDGGVARLRLYGRPVASQ